MTSWSLNGNHDMYSGGFGYFGTLLADPRFRAQRSPDGKPTSFFRLRSPSWDFVGLDTAWDTDVTSAGQIAVLQDPQAEYVADVAAGSSRRLVLFSHHQLVSFYDQADLGTTLPGKLAPVLQKDRVTAWWWGHEHRAVTYGAAQASATPAASATAACPSRPITGRRRAAARTSPGAAPARSASTAASGPGSFRRPRSAFRPDRGRLRRRRRLHPAHRDDHLRRATPQAGCRLRFRARGFLGPQTGKTLALCSNPARRLGMGSGCSTRTRLAPTCLLTASSPSLQCSGHVHQVSASIRNWREFMPEMRLLGLPAKP